MALIDLLKTRRSIRKYKPDAVEKHKLDMVLESARLAPSAANRQPWHFIVITDKTIKVNLKSAYSAERIQQAPVVIVCCADSSVSWKRHDGKDYSEVDAAIAMQNLILTASELGLGTCWIANFNEKIMKEILEIPDHISVVAMTPLGYSDEKKGAVEDRKPIEEMLHQNKW